MSDLQKCNRCGAPISRDAAGGHCLPCLLQLGIEAAPADEPGLKPGDRIGNYQLLEKIGEGGCGVVFQAEQLSPVRRKVALKVIKPGMDTRQVIARFEAERQALALLDHPNIAKVFDAGATDSGRPFFVMELVSGQKITDYCDQKKLSTRERLELFSQVCRAVEHAHQKGIIHRDLKPSNILVSDVDGGSAPSDVPKDARQRVPTTPRVSSESSDILTPTSQSSPNTETTFPNAGRDALPRTRVQLISFVRG